MNAESGSMLPYFQRAMMKGQLTDSPKGSLDVQFQGYQQI